MLWIHIKIIQGSRDQLAFDQSPELIAVFHALHRLLAPRHPPHALSSLAALIDPLLISPGLSRGYINKETIMLRYRLVRHKKRTRVCNELIFVSHDAYREILSFPHVDSPQGFGLPHPWASSS